MDGCVYEEITSTKTKSFLVNKDGASRRQSRTTIYEDEQR